MPIQTTYTRARAELAKLCDQVTTSREIVWITRRNRTPVALIAADELESLLETAHLVRSPKNAERLLAAIRQALIGEGQQQTIAQLRREVGLGQEAQA